MKDQILDVLKDIHEAKTLIEINDLLGLKTADELKELQKNIEELVNDFLVFKTKKDKYLLMKNCPGLKIGKLSVNKKGFGFLLLDKEDDIYIAKDDMNGAINDDTVLVEVTEKGLEPAGKVLKIVKRDLKNIVGEVKVIGKKKLLEPDDDKVNLKIILSPETSQNCVEGHKVLAKLNKKIDNKTYTADCLKILGHKDDAGIDILSIAYKYSIFEEFSPETIEELNNIPEEVNPSELEGRIDLTSEMIFTIDGADTKDIDDAISLKKHDDYYTLGVHIADVSHYVKENTGLGDDAYERGTSAYLADTVIPMLPHKLSNGICSLNEGTVRLTMSCVMDIDKNGKITNYDIFPSYIKSRKKMTYDNVNEILENNHTPDGYEDYVEKLKEMQELAKILRKRKSCAWLY